MQDETEPEQMYPENTVEPAPDHRMCLTDEGSPVRVTGILLDSNLEPTIRITISGAGKSGKSMLATIIARSIKKNLFDVPGKLRRPMKVLIATEREVRCMNSAIDDRPEPIYLITGTHAQFERYCRDNKLRIGVDACRIATWRGVVSKRSCSLERAVKALTF